MPAAVTGKLKLTFTGHDRIPLVAKFGSDFVRDYQKDVDLLSFHPSGKLLTGANHTAVRIWDVSNGRMVWETAGGRDPAIFNNGGKLLVTVGRVLCTRSEFCEESSLWSSV